MAMKKTLLAIVQDILSDTDGEPVNSLGDSLEAQQYAVVVQDTFYDILSRQSKPETQSLLKLTALSDASFPSHFNYPDNVTGVSKVWYDTSDDASFEYTAVDWCNPDEFLRRTDTRSADYTAVTDKEGGTQLRITNNRHPSFYTSFDDYYIVMDAYKSTVDTTLQASKVRAFGTTFPIFDRTDDSYIPDMDSELHPYLVSESRARIQDQFKGGVTRKAEQTATRNKVGTQNDRHRTTQAEDWRKYGR